MSTRQKLLDKAYIPDKWEDVSCPVCNSNQRIRWERFGDKLQYTYVLCKKCHLVYLNPRPVYDDNFVMDAYEFYAENDKRYLITDDYYNKNTDFEAWEAELITYYDKARTHLLEIGTATGKFIFRAKPLFKKITGIDVSKRMAKMVKENLDIDVITEKFENYTTQEKYSCINMSHVLEHYPMPHIWLRKAKEIMEKDGILVISVPNMFSLDRLVKNLIKRLGLFINKWESWRTPDHLFEPTVKSMKYLINTEGFVIVDYFSYSRNKREIDKGFGKIYHRKFRLGSNLKFIVKSQH